VGLGPAKIPSFRAEISSTSLISEFISWIVATRTKDCWLRSCAISRSSFWISRRFFRSSQARKSIKPPSIAIQGRASVQLIALSGSRLLTIDIVGISNRVTAGPIILSYLVRLEFFNNIFNPLFRRVGCFCLSLERQRDKNRYRWTRGKTQRSEGWQGASVGAVSAKRGQVFILGFSGS